MSSSIFKTRLIELKQCHQIDLELQNKTDHSMYFVYRERVVRSEVVRVPMFLLPNSLN
jgi:hypothetical protein